MYDFHYNCFKKVDAELLFTDTEKKNQDMFMKNFLNTNICLTLAIFQKTQSFMMGKMK